MVEKPEQNFLTWIYPEVEAKLVGGLGRVNLKRSVDDKWPSPNPKRCKVTKEAEDALKATLAVLVEASF